MRKQMGPVKLIETVKAWVILRITHTLQETKLGLPLEEYLANKGIQCVSDESVV